MILLIKISLTLLLMCIGIYMLGNVISLDTHRVSKKLCTNHKSKTDILKDVKLERKRDWIVPNLTKQPILY